MKSVSRVEAGRGGSRRVGAGRGGTKWGDCFHKKKNYIKHLISQRCTRRAANTRALVLRLNILQCIFHMYTIIYITWGRRRHSGTAFECKRDDCRFDSNSEEWVIFFFSSGDKTKRGVEYCHSKRNVVDNEVCWR